MALMDVHQPDGVNYATQGGYVSWQNWDFRVGYEMLTDAYASVDNLQPYRIYRFDAREGLLLYTIGFNDTFQKQFRPLFYKMHMSELFLAYGDPRPPLHRKIVQRCILKVCSTKSDLHFILNSHSTLATTRLASVQTNLTPPSIAGAKPCSGMQQGFWEMVA